MKLKEADDKLSMYLMQQEWLHNQISKLSNKMEKTKTLNSSDRKKFKELYARLHSFNKEIDSFMLENFQTSNINEVKKEIKNISRDI